MLDRLIFVRVTRVLAFAVSAVVLSAASSLPPVDGYQPYVRKAVTNCSQANFAEQPGVVEFRDMVLSWIGGGNWGIFACSGYEHEEGRAWDWRINATVPVEFARVQSVLNWLTANDNEMARRTGLAYLIWNGRYLGFSAGEDHRWTGYDPCTANSSASQCHSNHVHFAFSWPGARRQTTWYTTNPRRSTWYPQSPVPLQVLARTGGGAVHLVREIGGGWSGTASLSLTPLAATTAEGTTHVLGVSPASQPAVAGLGSGRLFHAMRHADGSWADWSDPAAQTGELTGITHVAAATVQGEVHVVATASDVLVQGEVPVAASTGNTLNHTIRRADGTWTGWVNLLSDNAIGDVTATAVDGELHVSIIGGEQIRHATRDAAGVWSGFGEVANSQIGVPSSVSAAGTGGGELQAIIGTDNGTRQYHVLRRADGTWTAPEYIPGGNALDIATANVSGDLHVMMVSSNGSLLHSVRTGEGGWIPAVAVPGLPGTAQTVAIAGN